MWRALFCWFALATSLNAQDGATTDRLEAAFHSWLGDNAVAAGSMAIRYQGAPVRIATKARAADQTAPLASLGKAVTALCAFDLTREGLLSWDDDITKYLGRGPETVTIAQLVTHQSGIGPDSTQRTMPGWMDADQHRSGEVLDAVDGRALAGPQGAYAYNNENYALLGLVIEAASGEPYRKTCGSRVFEAAGVPIPPPAREEGFLPWGGWAAPVDTFAALHAHWFGPTGPVGQDPFALPHADMGGGAFYGMGTVFRAFRGEHNFWHFGLLCMPGQVTAGSYAVNWMGEWSAVASFNACLGWDALFALDGALARAVFQP